jgi:SAM-dependent methyltransferase
MKGWQADTYGERWAAFYDQWVGEGRVGMTTDATVEVLAELAGGGRALELAIGTGRVALPLAQRGVDVHGIDASESMVGKLRDKPGGEAIPVTIGDFADVAVDGSFDLVYIVFNTFFALTTQEDQARGFANVAERLSPNGAFLLEGFVPDLSRFDQGQTVRALRVDLESVDIETSRHDPATQTVTSQHVFVSEEGIRLQPVHLRYAWPSELDLMARLAGLGLRERWGGWDRSPFDATSGAHVSVYARTPSA